MKLPKEKLDEIEYYEKHVKQGHNRMGVPYVEDIFVFHYGEYEKKWKLFGFTVWTETVPDRTERLSFERERTPPDEEGGKYKLAQTNAVAKLSAQLEAYFDSEFSEVYEALQRHEIDFIK